MGRSPCCDKSKVKKGAWSLEEDAILTDYIENYGITGNWIALPYKAGLQRCGKSCRLRWYNYLRPDIRHGPFTQAEQNVICHLYNEIGGRWSIIASHLPGRTDNAVKNYWNRKSRKKLISGNSHMKTKTDMAAAPTATTGIATTTMILEDKTTTSQDSTNLMPLLPNFSMPLSHYDNVTLPSFILEGYSSNGSSINGSCSFSPSHREPSLLRPLSLGLDGKYEAASDKEIFMDEYSSFEVMSGFWSQEKGIGADNNAEDLFSIFNNYSAQQPQRASQSH